MAAVTTNNASIGSLLIGAAISVVSNDVTDFAESNVTVFRLLIAYPIPHYTQKRPDPFKISGLIEKHFISPSLLSRF